MSKKDLETVMRDIAWCINRVRVESGKEYGDYEMAADEVCNKLCFLADFLLTLPTT